MTQKTSAKWHKNKNYKLRPFSRQRYRISSAAWKFSKTLRSLYLGITSPLEGLDNDFSDIRWYESELFMILKCPKKGITIERKFVFFLGNMFFVCRLGWLAIVQVSLARNNQLISNFEHEVVGQLLRHSHLWESKVCAGLARHCASTQNIINIFKYINVYNVNVNMCRLLLDAKSNTNNTTYKKNLHQDCKTNT